MGDALPLQSGSPDPNNVIESTQDGLPYPEVFVEDGFICIESHKDHSVIQVAEEVRVIRVFLNTETGQVTFRLKFLYKGQPRIQDVPREDCLDIKKLVELTKYGLDIMNDNVKIVAKHLRNQECLAPGQRTHEHVGWAMFENQLVFKHYKGIGFDSLYTGPLKIRPKGKPEKWLEMVIKHVIGNPHLELALVLGLSAPVVGLIGKHAGVPTLLVHLAGDSTRGKSTASMLAVSAFGCPGEGEGSLFGTWLATSNALVARLNGNIGVPIVLDEASMSNNRDFSNLIYRLAGGVDKSRLNKDARLKRSGQWSTTVISNGEFALSCKVNRNTGIRMRLLEFQNVTWTRDAASADAIKETVIYNYGFAGITLAEKLMEVGRKELLNKFNDWQARVYDSMENKDSFSHRIARKLALIMVTAELTREALGIDINVDNIKGILIENESLAVEERDLGSKAYEYFCEMLNTHADKFTRKYWMERNPIYDKQQCSILMWGELVETKGEEKVYILPEAFEKLMKEGQFEDPKIILKNWKQKGLIDCEKDRLTRKRKLNTSTPATVYCVKIKELDAEGKPVPTPSPPNRKRKKKAEVAFLAKEVDPNEEELDEIFSNFEDVTN